MQRLWTVLALCSTMLGATAFVLPVTGPRMRETITVKASSSSESLSRAGMLQAAGGALLGAVALLTVAPQASNAESTLASRKVLYFRYAPRIKNARDYLATDFKTALAKKDWAAVAAAYEIQKQAPDSSMRANPQRFTNKFERDLYSPMKIFSQSQSEKGASPKLAALLKAEGELEEALDRLQLVAKGDLKPPKKGGGGLFGFGGAEAPADKFTGMSQEKMANALYADAKTAFNAWVDVTNKAIIEVNKFEPLP